MIKRIVGLEGDVIRTRRPYPKKHVVVPRGQVWAEGDEAFHSVDSNTYGPIPIALITAKVTHIVYPFGRARRVEWDEGKARKGVIERRREEKIKRNNLECSQSSCKSCRVGLGKVES